jgi:crotonobetainyl-CoA:carnitine CoA-transferase CaiB-like acyl-CoA transferase
MDIGADDRFKTRESRRRNYEDLEHVLAPVFAKQTRAEWLKRLESNDVPAAPLYNIAEVLTDPQVNHLAVTEELDHPRVGKLKFVGGPVRFGENLSRQKSAAPPLLGEQTVAILSEMGYGRAVIDELAARGITKIARG